MSPKNDISHFLRTPWIIVVFFVSGILKLQSPGWAFLILDGLRFHFIFSLLLPLPMPSILLMDSMDSREVFSLLHLQPSARLPFSGTFFSRHFVDSLFCTFAFLWFNVPPAKFFMGDTEVCSGSLFWGDRHDD